MGPAMSIVIYGRRAYGRVHAHEGEFAETQFAHIDFLPLFPIQSYWITHDDGDQRFGFPIKLHLRSVAAAYLRVWGIGLALIAMIVSGSTAGSVAAAGLLALSIWSWTWRSMRGAARRRSDFNRVAFGARCEPSWMTRPHVAKLRASLDERWGRRDAARPPDDVARFGPNDVNEAVLAYGLLRLAAIDHREAAASADRILDSAFEPRAAEDGPYRDAQAALPAAGIGAAVSVSARAARRPASNRPKRWFRRPWVQLVGLLLATPSALGALAIAMTHVGTRDVTAKQLDSIYAPVGAHVQVHCDRIDAAGPAYLHGGSVAQLAFCELGKRILPVISVEGDPLPTTGTDLEGELRSIHALGERYLAPWERALHDDTVLDAASFDVFLHRDSADRRLMFVVMLCVTGAVAIGWMFWIRGFVGRRRYRRSSAGGGPAGANVNG